ncbi:5785_t:CDS:1, partial [Paraglomus brasilianum]
MEPKEKTMEVLNAMIKLPSSDSRVDGVAPPVLAAELITMDLPAEFLATALHYFCLSKRDDIFQSTIIPYLILQRLMMDAMSNKALDHTKVIIAWHGVMVTAQ